MITALKRLLKWRLSTNLFDRGVVVLAIGAFGGQGILLLAAPILTVCTVSKTLVCWPFIQALYL